MTIMHSLSRMDEDTDFYMKWINENIAYEYSDTEDLMNAYDLLSTADVLLYISPHCSGIPCGVHQARQEEKAVQWKL